MHDPAHDPERRMPRATRGPDENFRPKSAVTGSSSNESATHSRSNPTHPTGSADTQGDWLYPWHEEPETILDRLEEAMMCHPLPYMPKAVRTSPTELGDAHPTHSAADRFKEHWNE